MAQHDFAPAWLNFPTPPSSTKSTLNFEKHSENFSCTENRYEANRRRHNSSDGFDPNVGRASGGYFGRKEKTGWRSQGRNFTENLNHHGGYYGGSSRACTSAFHCGKGQGLHENNVPDNKTGKKEDRGVPKQFEPEDFPSLNPKYEREPNQNKSFAAGVWEYPLNPKSRCQRMLVIKKGTTKEVQITGFPVVGNLHSQPVKNGTGTSVYKGLVPKPVTPAVKYNRSNSSSPVDKVSQPRLTKLTRMQADKKSEFLKTLKQDRVEEEHENANDAAQNKNDESFDLHNSNSPPHERDINRNFGNEIPEENASASVTSQQIIQSSAFPQADALSSSLEAEHRLLKEMGWQEDGENDEAYAPLTEDEMREFRVISEQLRKNGLRKTGILKNSLIRDFKFSPWKTSTFKPALENEDSETSSSDTSDDDDM
ncbi:vasculin isoform X2 [Pezoporus wallicus]|uniref:vasculin isoform X2 n=1 Tax=Pezoporus wallicus TaxID=35540 RepID=UPI002549F9D3|nr:vasculin isoform X2 [Pezoporus wallicus]XP_061325350.1 vasculin isoform X2 [Pezoporus flaviventris]